MYYLLRLYDRCLRVDFGSEEITMKKETTVVETNTTNTIHKVVAILYSILFAEFVSHNYELLIMKIATKRVVCVPFIFVLFIFRRTKLPLLLKYLFSMVVSQTEMQRTSIDLTNHSLLGLSEIVIFN